MSDSEDELDDSPPFSHSPVSSTLECLPGLFHRSDADDFFPDYYFSEVSHAITLLQGLNLQRQTNTLCDVVIKVDDTTFPCHRSVLAACSPYFFAMFSGEMRESGEKTVHINGVDTEVMRQLIDFAYTSDISITQENAQQLLSAANMLQITSIREACSNFLSKEMDPSNCLGIHCFAEAHVCHSLAELSRQYTLRHFSDVCKHEELVLLSRSKLVDFIKSDELHVVSEDVVFQAAIDWLKHDPESRSAKMADVLSHVRLTLVNPYFLFDKLNQEPLLMENSACRSLILEANKYLLLQDRRGELRPNLTTQSRGRLAKHQLLFILGGEICSKNYLNAVDCYDLDCGAWIKRKELPHPRYQHCAVVSCDRYIYISGGFNKEKQVLTSVLRYEPVVDRLIKVAAMHTARVRHSMAAVDGAVYVVGGSDGRGSVFLASVEKYDPGLDRWDGCSPMPSALSRCQAAGLKGHLYVAGGVTGADNQFTDSFYRYTPVTDTWLTLTSMPRPRCLSGLVPLHGKLFGIGGCEEMRTATRKLMAFDPDSNEWSDAAEQLVTRFDPGVAYSDNKIYVISGHDGDNSFHHSIEVYDVIENKWNMMTSTKDPYGRCRFACVIMSVPAT